MQATWASVVAQVAQHLNAQHIIDLKRDGFFSPIEQADLITCFDYLEHLPDPENSLGAIAVRAQIGTVLVEACGPMHGWRTGHVLHRYGWEKSNEVGQIRIWRRVQAQQRTCASLMLFSFRSTSLPTQRSVMHLLASNPQGWRYSVDSEAGINVARSVQASKFYAETADDVFLMVDDDISFDPSDAEGLVLLCRAGYDIVGGAYPVRDGSHLALRVNDNKEVEFGPDVPPTEVDMIGTGFMAVHRRVLDAMVPTLNVCHGNSTNAFWPFFDFSVVEDDLAGGYAYLTEDYTFCYRARALGFKVWLDPTIAIDHGATVQLNIKNMAAVHRALTG